jgi:hypothetical protein
MRPTLICLVALAGCRGILDVPSAGKHGCPEPCMVTVSGRAVPAESLDPLNHALPNATVKLASLDPTQPPPVVTDDGGEYSFSGLPPGTPIAFNVSVPQTNPDVANLLHTVYVAGATDRNDVTLDLPIVRYRWLAQVAFQCGLFKSLDEALFAAPGTTTLNNYFLTRATILGEVLEADRHPAKLDAQDISVVIDEFANSNQNPSDTQLPPPATLCFLEPDPTTGEYKGVKETQSTSGRFVLFRARNMLGTGTGTGEVRIPGFPVAALDVSSGSIGFAFIRRGSSTSLPERPLTFERDIYHFFKDKTCNAVCHRPGGVALDVATARDGPNGVMYPADWSGSVDEVYDNLTKPFDTDCELADDDHDTAARVCRAMATKSLLYQKPGGLVPHKGLDLTTDDDMVIAILRWIQDGAILR